MRALRTMVACVVLMLLAAMAASAQSTPQERGEDLMVRRQAASYTVSAVEPVYLRNNILFELSEAGWQALTGINEDVCHQFSWWPGYINEFSKRMGYGDIESIESHGSKEAAVAAAEQLKGKVVFRLRDDGVSWTPDKANYFFRIAGETLGLIGGSNDFTPNNGAFLVTFTFTPKVKDIVVAYDKATGSFSIQAPSEVEPPEWDSKIKAGLAKGGKF